SQFGEDMQTIWVIQTPPAGTYTKSWHTEPQTAVYGGHVGINGNSVNPGWGPYEHLPPSAWTNTIGEQYRRCCTSVSWIGEALAARLIPGMQAAWNHPQFFAYTDRWMFVPDDPNDLAAMQNEAGLSLDSDFWQGQSWKILSGGGYHQTYVNFVDLMWAAYRNVPQISAISYLPGGSVSFTVQNLNPNTTNYIQVRTNLSAGTWATISTNVIGAWSSISANPTGTNIIVSNFFAFQGLPSTNNKSFYRVQQLP
ncbi:MAG TPA: hypothetical protein VN048_14600, partial [Verrucomicrobiae bacterium]|nr:hypothetical protein [Verrucomicrobiae bacterium]